MLKPIFAAAILFAHAAAFAQATPVGLWKSIDDETKKEKSLIRISDSGGVLTGKLEKLLDPATAPDATCDKCNDERKDKPIPGMVILRGLKPDGDVFAGGEILDPNNGKTYRCKLTVKEGGKRLDVRGFIGISLIGRTQSWLREE